MLCCVWQQGEGIRVMGEELEKEGKLQEAIDTYNMGIICWYENDRMKKLYKKQARIIF